MWLVWISVHAQSFSCIWVFATPGTVAHQAPLFMWFPRREYWSGLPPSPGDLPDMGIKPTSPVSPALAGRFFTTEPPAKTHLSGHTSQNQTMPKPRNHPQHHLPSTCIQSNTQSYPFFSKFPSKYNSRHPSLLISTVKLLGQNLVLSLLNHSHWLIHLHSSLNWRF